MRRIRPADVNVDWNADPTALPYMLYQINKRTDLPVFINNWNPQLLTIWKGHLFSVIQQTISALGGHIRDVKSYGQ